MSSGLTQRRRNAAGSDAVEGDSMQSPVPSSQTADSSSNAIDGGASENDRDSDNEEGKGRKGGSKLTLLEEVLLLGLKDDQGYLSFWNDNISYVLRGCILMELSLRGRIKTVMEIRKRPYADRLIKVVDERPTGEVLLDEALKLIKLDEQSISSWIDLLSGETWNIMKIGYQLKQVRERIMKGLVDKGILRTGKRNFVLFDMATHPVSDHSVKEELVRRSIDCLLGRGPPADKRTIAMVCAAYAANVLENALVNLSHAQRETCFQRVDELLQEHASMTQRAQQQGTTEIVAG
ncbi:Golgi phosphoprotein 3-domain-containing protein [Phlyctochytrium arcticum]|nr:Golgi phosphoprotein 3-domain-containing protein [Phlyctochytrium arcticum]